MAQDKIMVVDNEMEIIQLIKLYLSREGYEVVWTTESTKAAELAQEEKPDLILLDVVMPGLSGIELCGRIREQSDVPILFVSCRDQDMDKVLGLSIGGDDYITKPFGSAELLARIRTSLRHSNRMNTSSDQLFRPYKCDDLVLDFEKRTLTICGEIVHLTPIEYKILVFLAQNCGKVMTYSSIINNVWGPYADDNNRILRVNMTNIRRKIETNPADPKYIFTEVGVGYRMSEEH